MKIYSYKILCSIMLTCFSLSFLNAENCNVDDHLFTDYEMEMLIASEEAYAYVPDHVRELILVLYNDHYDDDKYAHCIQNLFQGMHIISYELLKDIVPELIEHLIAKKSILNHHDYEDAMRLLTEYNSDLQSGNAILEIDNSCFNVDSVENCSIYRRSSCKCKVFCTLLVRDLLTAGTLNVQGNATVGGNLTVNGTASFPGGIVGPIAIGATGTACNTLEVTVNGSESVTGNLNLATFPSTSSCGMITGGALGTRLLSGFGIAGDTSNIFVGNGSGSTAATATGNNSGFGANSLSSLTTGISNTAIGSAAGASVTTGSSNIFIGNSADLSPAFSTSVNNTIVVGSGATTVTSLPPTFTAGANQAMYGFGATPLLNQFFSGNITNTGSILFNQGAGTGVLQGRRLSAVGTPSNPATAGSGPQSRILWGTLAAAAGTAFSTSSGGMSMAHTVGTGIYTITFDQAFGAVPAVVVTADNSAAPATSYYVDYSGATTAGVVIRTFSAANTPTDEPFSVIIMGVN